MCLRMCPRAACAARAEWVDMCKGHVVGWCMVWGERVQNGVEQHHITNGVGIHPWNHRERSWGTCLRMCRRVACAEWVDMCKGHCGMAHVARREGGKWCGSAPNTQWSGLPPLEPSGKELGHVLADVSTRGLCCPC